MLLTNIQVSTPCKAFANGSSGNTKLSKTQLHKIGQWGEFIGRVLVPLLKTRLRPLKLTAAALPTDAGVHKKKFGSSTRSSDLGKQTALIISND